MQLVIVYQDSSKRIINLPPQFFETDEIKVGYKVISVTPVDKAISIVNDNGRNPYHVLLTRNNEIVFENKVDANKPHVLVDTEVIHPNISQKEINRLKKQQFQFCWKPRLMEISWERAINLLISLKNATTSNK